MEHSYRHRTDIENIVRCAKNTGIEHLPSKSYEINQAWCTAAMIACDLLCWLRLLCLDGPLAKAEPKTLRYRLLHTTVRLVRGQRKRKLKIPQAWPWARELEACFLAAFALPPPTRATTPLTQRSQGTPSRPVEPAPTRRDSRATSAASHPKPRSETEVKTTKADPGGKPATPVNNQG